MAFADQDLPKREGDENSRLFELYRELLKEESDCG